ncbi:hypothetical protein HK097_000438, partial [Rhizophlyctis rosea]
MPTQSTPSSQQKLTEMAMLEDEQDFMTQADANRLLEERTRQANDGRFSHHGWKDLPTLTDADCEIPAAQLELLKNMAPDRRRKRTSSFRFSGEFSPLRSGSPIRSDLPGGMVRAAPLTTPTRPSRVWAQPVSPLGSEHSRQPSASPAKSEIHQVVPLSQEGNDDGNGHEPHPPVNDEPHQEDTTPSIDSIYESQIQMDFEAMSDISQKDDNLPTDVMLEDIEDPPTGFDTIAPGLATQQFSFGNLDENSAFESDEDEFAGLAAQTGEKEVEDVPMTQMPDVGVEDSQGTWHTATGGSFHATEGLGGDVGAESEEDESRIGTQMMHEVTYLDEDEEDGEEGGASQDATSLQDAIGTQGEGAIQVDAWSSSPQASQGAKSGRNPPLTPGRTGRGSEDVEVGESPAQKAFSMLGKFVGGIAQVVGLLPQGGVGGDDEDEEEDEEEEEEERDEMNVDEEEQEEHGQQQIESEESGWTQTRERVVLSTIQVEDDAGDVVEVVEFADNEEESGGSQAADGQVPGGASQQDLGDGPASEQVTSSRATYQDLGDGRTSQQDLSDPEPTPNSPAFDSLPQTSSQSQSQGSSQTQTRAVPNYLFRLFAGTEHGSQQIVSQRYAEDGDGVHEEDVDVGEGVDVQEEVEVDEERCSRSHAPSPASSHVALLDVVLSGGEDILDENGDGVEDGREFRLPDGGYLSDEEEGRDGTIDGNSGGMTNGVAIDEEDGMEDLQFQEEYAPEIGEDPAYEMIGADGDEAAGGPDVRNENPSQSEHVDESNSDDEKTEVDEVSQRSNGSVPLRHVDDVPLGRVAETLDVPQDTESGMAMEGEDEDLALSGKPRSQVSVQDSLGAAGEVIMTPFASSGGTSVESRRGSVMDDDSEEEVRGAEDGEDADIPEEVDGEGSEETAGLAGSESVRDTDASVLSRTTSPERRSEQVDRPTQILTHVSDQPKRPKGLIPVIVVNNLGKRRVAIKSKSSVSETHPSSSPPNLAKSKSYPDEATPRKSKRKSLLAIVDLASSEDEAPTPLNAVNDFVEDADHDMEWTSTPARRKKVKTYRTPKEVEKRRQFPVLESETDEQIQDNASDQPVGDPRRKGKGPADTARSDLVTEEAVPDSVEDAVGLLGRPRKRPRVSIDYIPRREWGPRLSGSWLAPAAGLGGILGPRSSWGPKRGDSGVDGISPLKGPGRGTKR